MPGEGLQGVWWWVEPAAVVSGKVVERGEAVLHRLALCIQQPQARCSLHLANAGDSVSGFALQRLPRRRGAGAGR